MELSYCLSRHMAWVLLPCCLSRHMARVLPAIMISVGRWMLDEWRPMHGSACCADLTRCPNRPGQPEGHGSPEM